MGPGSEMLVRSLVAAAPSQLRRPIEHARVHSRMRRDEAVMDTISWAWEVLREDPAGIGAARSPWASWTTRTLRVTLHGRDQRLPEGVKEVSCDPALLPDSCGAPGELAPVLVGLAELDGPLTGLVEALVVQGMDEPLAWAGTLRMAQLALRGRSRAQTAAAQDPCLADLGVSEQCARAWMTVLTGSRRGAKGGLLDMSDGELSERAADVVQTFTTTTGTASDL